MKHNIFPKLVGLLLLVFLLVLPASGNLNALFPCSAEIYLPLAGYPSGSSSSPGTYENFASVGTNNPWSTMLSELLQDVAGYAVPLALALFFGWLGKRLGFDIPAAVQAALEAFIFKVLAQIKAEHAGKSNQQMQHLAAQIIKNQLPNNLLRVLMRKYGSVEGAIEYFYPRWVGLKKRGA